MITSPALVALKDTDDELREEQPDGSSITVSYTETHWCVRHDAVSPRGFFQTTSVAQAMSHVRQRRQIAAVRAVRNAHRTGDAPIILPSIIPGEPVELTLHVQCKGCGKRLKLILSEENVLGTISNRLRLGELVCSYCSSRFALYITVGDRNHDQDEAIATQLLANPRCNCPQRPGTAATRPDGLKRATKYMPPSHRQGCPATSKYP